MLLITLSQVSCRNLQHLHRNYQKTVQYQYDSIHDAVIMFYSTLKTDRLFTLLSLCKFR